jgi:uncharacterized protein YdhG (YjbR/CyaY superfamily)
MEEPAMSDVVKTVDEYIKQFPPEIQKGLKELRAFVKAEAPEAEEKQALMAIIKPPFEEDSQRAVEMSC